MLINVCVGSIGVQRGVPDVPGHTPITLCGADFPLLPRLFLVLHTLTAVLLASHLSSSPPPPTAAGMLQDGQWGKGLIKM